MGAQSAGLNEGGEGHHAGIAHGFVGFIQDLTGDGSVGAHAKHQVFRLDVRSYRNRAGILIVLVESLGEIAAMLRNQ